MNDIRDRFASDSWALWLQSFQRSSGRSCSPAKSFRHQELPEQGTRNPTLSFKGYMPMHIHIHIQRHIYIYTCIRIRSYMQTHAYAYHVYIYIYIQLCVKAHTHMYASYEFIFIGSLGIVVVKVVCLMAKHQMSLPQNRWCFLMVFWHFLTSFIYLDIDIHHF